MRTSVRYSKEDDVWVWTLSMPGHNGVSAFYFGNAASESAAYRAVLVQLNTLVGMINREAAALQQYVKD